MRYLEQLAKSLAFLILLTGLAHADATEPKADIKGAKDTTLLKRYEGSFIVDYAQKAFDEASFPLSVLKPTDKIDGMNNHVYLPEKAQALEGRVTRLVYVVPAGRSPLEVTRNYEDEVAGKGGEVLYACKGEDCGGDATRGIGAGGNTAGLLTLLYPKSEMKAAAFSNGACALDSNRASQRYSVGRIPTADGEAYVAVLTYTMSDTLYCKVLNDRTVAIVMVVEPKAREKKMVLVKAEQMGSEIGKSGRVALYGIYFDTDKAALKPESDATLDEIGKLLKADPALKIYVVGHTDNVGEFSHNMKLSEARAASVVAALVAKQGIAKDRLQPAGVGPVSPMASNDDEAGRAKNRRVELVKR